MRERLNEISCVEMPLQILSEAQAAVYIGMSREEIPYSPFRSDHGRAGIRAKRKAANRISAYRSRRVAAGVKSAVMETPARETGKTRPDKENGRGFRGRC
jgi:hypothetical protein